jgi:hypothetical protein
MNDMFNERKPDMLTTTPFETLSVQMSGRIVTPSDPDWDATRRCSTSRWTSGLPPWRSPATHAT